MITLVKFVLLQILDSCCGWCHHVHYCCDSSCMLFWEKKRQVIEMFVFVLKLNQAEDYKQLMQRLGLKKKSDNVCIWEKSMEMHFTTLL